MSTSRKQPRKKRRDMTDSERARDWEDRLSPRWWGVVFGLYGLAILGFIASAVMQAFIP
jgi:hypothetical protein